MQSLMLKFVKDMGECRASGMIPNFSKKIGGRSYFDDSAVDVMKF